MAGTTVRPFSSTMAWLARRKLWRGGRPIVIGGCARSGTTLMLSLLSSHSRIAAIPFETQALCPTAYHHRPKPESTIDTRLIRKYLSFAAVQPGSNCWCEKTPRNVHFFGEILRKFGNSVRLIHVVRDGRDVVCSTHPDDPTRFWVSPERWVEDVTAGLAFEGHDQVLTLRYEDLVTRFRETNRRLVDFLDLGSVGSLDAYPHFATVKTSNAWTSPAHAPDPASIGRWREPAYRSRALELTKDERAVKLLRHFNYV